jgi:hypothetical protein
MELLGYFGRCIFTFSRNWKMVSKNGSTSIDPASNEGEFLSSICYYQSLDFKTI